MKTNKLKVPQLGLVLTTDITILIMTISEVYVAAYLVVRKPKNVTMPTLMIDIFMINKQHNASFPFIRQLMISYIISHSFLTGSLEPKNDQLSTSVAS